MDTIIFDGDFGYTAELDNDNEVYNDYGITVFVTGDDNTQLWINISRYNDEKAAIGWLDISEINNPMTQAEVAIEYAMELVDELESSIPRIFGTCNIYEPLCNALSVHQANMNR